MSGWSQARATLVLVALLALAGYALVAGPMWVLVGVALLAAVAWTIVWMDW